MIDHAKLVRTYWPEWELRERLGSGSYGVVYSASRTDLGGVTTWSAIKVIRVPKEDTDEDQDEDGFRTERSASYLESVVRDLSDEIRMMEAVKGNTNIVSIEDHFITRIENENVWIILIRMELLTPLRRHMAREPLDETEVIKLGTDVVWSDADNAAACAAPTDYALSRGAYSSKNLLTSDGLPAMKLIKKQKADIRILPRISAAVHKRIICRTGP